MVGGTPKPFACTSEGCLMAFTNEDHLSVHQRKHEMVLNLGIKNTNIVADQTPTPTRFLRNCEEVGLFQDLQNVNPFEETFRRAVEMVKTGSLPEPDLPEDDTLHTPHVFPHLPEENVSLYSVQNCSDLKQNKIIITENGTLGLPVESSDKSQPDLLISDKSTLNNEESNPDHIYALTASEKQPELCSKTDTDKNSASETQKSKKLGSKSLAKSVGTSRLKKIGPRSKPRVDAPKSSSAKLKLQQVLLQNKKQQRKNTESSQSIIVLQGVQLDPSSKIIQSVVPVLRNQTELPILPKFEAVSVPSQQVTETITLFSTTKKSCKQSLVSYDSSSSVRETSQSFSSRNQEEKDPKRLEMLERNRAAALRCRERKKQWIGNLESKYQSVCKGNLLLQREVANLKNEIVYLKTLLLAHKECPVTKAMNMGQNIPIGPAQIVNIRLPRPGEDVSKTVQKSTSNSTSGTNAEICKELKPSVIVLNDTYTSLSH